MYGYVCDGMYTFDDFNFDETTQRWVLKGGLCLNEYKPLIQAAESTGRKVFPMENVLFRREVLALYRLVVSGEMGEIVYCL